MKFKKGKLYRVTKHTYNPVCVGCVLKYKGLNPDNKYCGHPIPFFCKLHNNWEDRYERLGCWIFQWALNRESVELIEHTDMIKFCKKLRKELKNDKKD